MGFKVLVGLPNTSISPENLAGEIKSNIHKIKSIQFTTTMLEKSKSLINSSVSSSSKCNNTNSHEFTGDTQLHFWPPSPAAVDGLVLKFKAKIGDTESNWEKIILNFKKELDEEEEEEQLKAPSSSGIDIDAGAVDGDGIDRREKSRAKFSVPLSRREMEKDFEDMGERRLPRKPKKRPKIVQNQLDVSIISIILLKPNRYYNIL